jgi:hypothetical protein
MTQPNICPRRRGFKSSLASLVRNLSWNQTSISYVNFSIKLNFNQTSICKPWKLYVFWIYVMLFQSSDTFRKEFCSELDFHIYYLFLGAGRVRVTDATSHPAPVFLLSGPRCLSLYCRTKNARMPYRVVLVSLDNWIKTFIRENVGKY